MNINKIIKEEREKQGMSQQTLAEKAGFSRKTIEYWESGKRGIKLENADSVLKALGLSITIGIKNDK